MEKEKIHKHGGKSSQRFLDPVRVLTTIKLSEGDFFMDAGCGDGYLSLAASKIVGDEGQIFSVDSYQESLDILIEKIQKEGINNINVIAADFTTKIPLDDDSVDLCMMANVFHGFFFNDEVKEALGEIRRLLKPEGRLAVIEFKKIDNTPGPPVSSRMDPDEVRSALEEDGFEYIEEMEVGPYHYVVISKLK
jgi:ubiquinone/menaquinone biosynthesis C-methylase UbiE